MCLKCEEKNETEEGRDGVSVSVLGEHRWAAGES